MTMLIKNIQLMGWNPGDKNGKNHNSYNEHEYRHPGKAGSPVALYKFNNTMAR